MSSASNHQPTPVTLLNSAERLRLFVEAAEDYAIVILDPDGCVADWNSGAQRLLGWPEDEIVGRPAAVFLPGSIGPGGPAAQGVTCVRKDGSSFRARITTKPVHDTNGIVSGYATVIRDLTAVSPTDGDSVRDQPWLTTTIDSAMDAIITVNASQRIILFNKAAEAMFHCSAAEVHGANLERFIPHRFHGAHAQHIRAFGATGVTSRTMGHPGTLNAVKTTGGEFPIEASISQAQVGGEKLFTVNLRDITQRRRAEERQSLLLLELSHRVKNSLAIVQSIVVQTRRFAKPDAFHDALTRRLAALGNAHDLLANSDWAGATLADVVRSALEPHDSPGIVERWTADGPGIWLASNEVVTLSLVFHELAANAARHGALSPTSGTVTVEWALDSKIDPARLIIRWREQGGPAVIPPTHSGFGSRLISRAMSHELAGHATLCFYPAGAECTLELPLSQKVNVRQ